MGYMESPETRIFVGVFPRSPGGDFHQLIRLFRWASRLCGIGVAAAIAHALGSEYLQMLPMEQTAALEKAPLAVFSYYSGSNQGYFVSPGQRIAHHGFRDVRPGIQGLSRQTAILRQVFKAGVTGVSIFTISRHAKRRRSVKDLKELIRKPLGLEIFPRTGEREFLDFSLFFFVFFVA